MKVVIMGGFISILGLLYRSCMPKLGVKVMAAWRRAIELSLGDEDTVKLRSIAQSRTERRAGSNERGYCWPIGKIHRFLRSVGRSDCIIRPFSAASNAPWLKARWLRSTIARAPVGSLRSPSKPRHGWYRWHAGRRDLGYPHELWTTRLLASHAREHGPAEGHACLANLAQGTVCKILDQEEVKPHKVRYYLEQRDPDFAEKMAEVLCVYRQVKILKKAAAASKQKPNEVAIIS